MWVQSLGWEDPLEEDMATHSRTHAWRIPMDRGAWWATVHSVSKNWTWLKWLGMHCLCTVSWTELYRWVVSSWLCCVEWSWCKEWHIFYFPAKIKNLLVVSQQNASHLSLVYAPMWFLIGSFYSAHSLQTYLYALRLIVSHLEQKSQLLH